MKIIFENLGILRCGEIQTKNFAVICGSNNSGKTYVTYAFYGFLKFWKNDFQIPVDKKIISKLKETGVYTLNLLDYQKPERAQSIIDMACSEYRHELPFTFSASQNKFENVRFEIQAEDGEVRLLKTVYSGGLKPSNSNHEMLRYQKEEGRSDIVFTLFAENASEEIPDFIVMHAINQAIKNTVFCSIFPDVFIVSAERTGAAIFRGELNFARNKLLDALSDKDKKITPLDLIGKTVSDYALPVDDNVDFIRSLESVSKTNSFLVEQHPEILKRFSDILGGDYQTKNGELYFVPTKKSVKLSMDESSSSVRSLLLLGFYLRHIAKPNDLLMIDEPELNLHPENQRKVARLLASLVSCGLKIFITTHSDYILRELSNLVLLNGDRQHLSKILEDEGYIKEELLPESEVCVYIAKKDKVLLPGKDKGKKQTHQTLVNVKVDNEQGIHISSFDETIETMNRITDAIIYGE